MEGLTSPSAKVVPNPRHKIRVLALSQHTLYSDRVWRGERCRPRDIKSRSLIFAPPPPRSAVKFNLGLGPICCNKTNTTHWFYPVPTPSSGINLFPIHHGRGKEGVADRGEGEERGEIDREPAQSPESITFGLACDAQCPYQCAGEGEPFRRLDFRGISTGRWRLAEVDRTCFRGIDFREGTEFF